jgi:hypothetical protein
LKVFGQRNEECTQLITKSFDENLKFIPVIQEQEIMINDSLKSIKDPLAQIQSHVKRAHNLVV